MYIIYLCNFHIMLLFNVEFTMENLPIILFRSIKVIVGLLHQVSDIKIQQGHQQNTDKHQNPPCK